MGDNINQKINLFQFENFSALRGLLHFSTERSGGVSDGIYASLNLGFNSGDRPENIIENRKLLCKHLDISDSQLIFPKQTHSATIKIIDNDFFDLNEQQRFEYLTETDALITATSQVCIAIKTADCVPILLYDPETQVAAAIHAGWRGTAQKIVLKTVGKMVDRFGCIPEDILAGIGPSISPDVYEVGEEVWSQFDNRFTELNGKEGKRLLNLWEANRNQLMDSGLKPDKIELSKLCTFSNPRFFFSARRDGAKSGRMASGIMIR